MYMYKMAPYVCRHLPRHRVRKLYMYMMFMQCMYMSNVCTCIKSYRMYAETCREIESDNYTCMHAYIHIHIHVHEIKEYLVQIKW